MKTHFGPWTTAIDTGSTAQLSAFWKRRMAMLARIGNCPRSCSRRAVVMLISLCAVALFLPNLRTTPDSMARAGDSTKPDAPSATAPPSVEFFPRPSDAEKKIEAALDAPVSVEFNDTPLSEALELLHKRTGVNLFLDKKALAEEGVKSGEKMLLRAKDVPLRRVLSMTLSQANLKFIVVDDVLKVTTHAEADQRQITRTYPVADLIVTDMGPDFDSLTQMLTSVVDPTTWHENGGPAAVQPNFDSKSLVVSQTYANHEQVLSLLRSLRAAKQRGETPGDRQNKLKKTAPRQGADDKKSSRRLESWERLGLTLEPAPAEMFRGHGARYRGGLSVTNVSRDSPAAQQGMRSGDILVGLHVYETKTLDDFNFAMARAEQSQVDSLKFHLLRDREMLYGRMNVEKSWNKEPQRLETQGQYP